MKFLEQDHGRLCSQVKESLRYLLRHWNKVREHFNCMKIREQSMNRDTTSHQLLRNLLMILDKENRVRVVHYESVDPMKDKKFSNRILYLVCLVIITTTTRLPQANLLVTVEQKEFFPPQRCHKCNQCRHILCKCKDETVIHFSCKKQECIGRGHPNPKKESNS
ncbi:hypothetical protein CR513_12582, partial [Mucuna pruriens]